MSNLIEFKHNEDYGNGYYVQILKIKDYIEDAVMSAIHDYFVFDYDEYQ
jgi:hypothetical protein